MTKPMPYIVPFEKLTAEQKRFRLLGTPIMPSITPQVITDVRRPWPDEMYQIKFGRPVRVKKIVEVTDSNGTVKIAVDENGTVVDAEKKGLTPLQMGMIAVGAFLLFGG